jgi:hypothetical protein
MNKYSLEEFQRVGAEGGRKGGAISRIKATCRKLRLDGNVATAEAIEAACLNGVPTPLTVHSSATREKIRQAALISQPRRRAAAKAAKEAAQ